jgi:hypothetical protein
VYSQQVEQLKERERAEAETGRNEAALERARRAQCRRESIAALSIQSRVRGRQARLAAHAIHVALRAAEADRRLRVLLRVLTARWRFGREQRAIHRAAICIQAALRRHLAYHGWYLLRLARWQLSASLDHLMAFHERSLEASAVVVQAHARRVLARNERHRAWLNHLSSNALVMLAIARMQARVRGKRTRKKRRSRRPTRPSPPGTHLLPSGMRPLPPPTSSTGSRRRLRAERLKDSERQHEPLWRHR